jgi:hypothetical protein
MKKHILTALTVVVALAGCSNAEMDKVTRQLDDLHKPAPQEQTTNPSSKANPISEFIRNRNTKDCIGLAEVLDASNSHGNLITALKNQQWQSVIDQSSADGGDKTTYISLAIAHYNLGDFRQCLAAIDSAKSAGAVAPTLDELKGSAEYGLSTMSNIPTPGVQPAVVPVSAPTSAPAESSGSSSAAAVAVAQVEELFNSASDEFKDKNLSGAVQDCKKALRLADGVLPEGDKMRVALLNLLARCQAGEGNLADALVSINMAVHEAEQGSEITADQLADMKESQSTLQQAVMRN